MGLSDIVVETDTPDTDTIAEVLAPYYHIHVPSGRVERTSDFDALPTREQAIAALFVLELRAELADEPWEGATVTEIGDAMGCGWDQYGFYSTLRGQEQNRVIARTRDGLYRIPPIWANDALNLLSSA